MVPSLLAGELYVVVLSAKVGSQAVLGLPCPDDYRKDDIINLWR